MPVSLPLLSAPWAQIYKYFTPRLYCYFTCFVLVFLASIERKPSCACSHEVFFTNAVVVFDILLYTFIKNAVVSRTLLNFDDL